MATAPGDAPRQPLREVGEQTQEQARGKDARNRRGGGGRKGRPAAGGQPAAAGAGGRTSPRKKGKRNTTDFAPSHAAPDARMMFAIGMEPTYPHTMRTRDVTFVPALFADIAEPGELYEKLVAELEAAKEAVKRPGRGGDLMKLWHNDSHLIADDKAGWKRLCPTFKAIVDRMQEYFQVDIKATRLNHYRDTKEWKPFHHDAAAVKADKAKTQNVTIACSFGVTRDVAFQHAKTGTVVSMPVTDGSAYVFGRDVNVDWKHGILQCPPEDQVEEGRISIIAWGWIDQEEG